MGVSPSNIDIGYPAVDSARPPSLRIKRCLWERTSIEVDSKPWCGAAEPATGGPGAVERREAHPDGGGGWVGVQASGKSDLMSARVNCFGLYPGIYPQIERVRGRIKAVYSTAA